MYIEKNERLRRATRLKWQTVNGEWPKPQWNSAPRSLGRWWLFRLKLDVECWMPGMLAWPKGCSVGWPLGYFADYLVGAKRRQPAKETNTAKKWQQNCIMARLLAFASDDHVRRSSSGEDLHSDVSVWSSIWEEGSPALYVRNSRNCCEDEGELCIFYYYYLFR